MLYKDYLRRLKKCPFCEISKKEIIKQNGLASLILAKAPYTKHHLLAIPKMHVTKINNMSDKEKDAIQKLICYGMKKLHEKYRNVSILYKEGNKKEIGKSINHLHYHLIPELKIGGNKIRWEKRKILSDKNMNSLLESLKIKNTS